MPTDEPGERELEAVAGPAARALLADTITRSGAAWYYIFWLAGSGAAAGSGQRRARTVVAFPTADAALAFAQQNGLHTNPPAARLRRVSLARLLLLLLREPTIAALLLANDHAEATAPGHYPTGLRLERDTLLRELKVKG